MRARKGSAQVKKRKRLLRKAEGYWGLRSKQYRRAKETLMRAWNYATRDRRVRKREFRALWITRINAAVRHHGMTYSRFIYALAKAKIPVNRKILSEIAIHDPEGFGKIVEQAKKAS